MKIIIAITLALIIGVVLGRLSVLMGGTDAVAIFKDGKVWCTKIEGAETVSQYAVFPENTLIPVYYNKTYQIKNVVVVLKP